MKTFILPSNSSNVAINKSLLKSLEFVVNGVIRKIFCILSNYVINDCLFHFNYVVFDAIHRRKIWFL